MVTSNIGRLRSAYQALSVPAMRPNLRTAAIVVGFWTVYALTSAGSLIDMRSPDGHVFTPDHFLAIGLTAGYVWIPVNWLLLILVPRVHFGRNSFWRPLALYALVTVGAVLYRMATMVVFHPLVVGDEIPQPPLRGLLWMSLLQSVYLTLLMIGAVHALWYARRDAERERRAEQLEASLVAARLEALRAQLDPHFLFNTLNSISELVHRDAHAADRMIVGLGELLRASLDNRHVTQIPLREELALVRHYLAIEALRLGDRLRVRFEVSAGLDDVLVPPLTLQPLAENAIVHALGHRRAPGELAIRAAAREDTLEIEIEDDGNEEPGRGSGGIGLTNLRSRLQCLYGDASDVALERRARGGTNVRVRLPLRRAEAES